MTDQGISAVSGDPAEDAEDRFVARVTVLAAQADELLRREDLDFGDHPRISPNPDGTGVLTLFVSLRQAQGLRDQGLSVEVGENMSARGRERVAEVGQGDRFESGRVVPRGIGRKVGGGSSEGGYGDQQGEDRPR